MSGGVLGNPPCTVPANAVRVWRGYRNAQLDVATFLSYLGATFIPAATLMQPPAGLRAYLPGVFASETLPAGVPEETALLFWDSQSAYQAATGATLGERVYELTHAGTYDLAACKNGFAAALANPLVSETPYYLFDTPADWMQGNAFQLMVSATVTAQMLAALGSWAASVVANPPAGLTSAYLCAGEQYIAWWELWDAAAAPSAALRDALAANGTVLANGPSVPAMLTASLEIVWPGITVQAGDLYNMQFNRPTGA